MGLRLGDLKDNVDHIFEIDSFKSKMGTDADIVTLSFSVKEKHAADDLMNFIEKGYPFVLDADANTIYADNVVLCTQSNGLSSILRNSNSIVQNNWMPYDNMKTWCRNTFYSGFGFQLHFKCKVDMPEDW